MGASESVPMGIPVEGSTAPQRTHDALPINSESLAAPLAGGLEHPSDDAGSGHQPRKTTFIQGRKASLVIATLNVMNAIMGSGILALPSVMAENGLVLYIGLQLGIMVIVDFSLHLLVRSALARNAFSYEKLGIEAFGSRGRVLVCLTIVVQNMGAILSYMIVVGDLAPVLLSFFLPHVPADERRALLMALFVLGVSMPLACSPKLGLLGYTSFLCFLVMLNLCVLAFVEHARLCLGGSSSSSSSSTVADDHLYFSAAAYDGAGGNHTGGGGGGELCPAIALATPGLGVARALPTLCFSFVCHTTYLPVLDELTGADALGRSRRPAWRVATVGHVAIGLAGCLYMWAAVFGYLTFGESVQGDLWLSYAAAVPVRARATATPLATLPTPLTSAAPPCAGRPVRDGGAHRLPPRHHLHDPAHLLPDAQDDHGALLGARRALLVAAPPAAHLLAVRRLGKLEDRTGGLGDGLDRRG